MTTADSASPDSPRARALLPLLLTLLVLLILFATWMHYARRAWTSHRSLTRYEMRVDHADGHVESDVLIFHGGGTFVYVRQHWQAGAKKATIESSGTVGEWSSGLFGSELEPTRTWHRAGMDFRNLRGSSVEGDESIPWSRTRNPEPPGVRIGPSAMTGRPHPLVISNSHSTRRRHR